MVPWIYVFVPLTGVVVSYVCYYVVKSGLFDRVVVSVTDRPPVIGKSITVFYKHHVGAYSGVAKLYKECTELVPKGTMSIGLYYDDPTVVEAFKLNSIVGIVTDGLSENYVSQLERWGYKKAQLPAVSRAVLCTQRFTGMLSLLKMIKYTYGRMGRWSQEKRLTDSVRMAIEVYVHESDGGKVHMMFPLDHNEELTVPEVAKRQAAEKN